MNTSALFILCALYIGTIYSYAQKSEGEIRKGQIGITFSSLGENDVIRFQELTGAASYNGDKFYTFGISYLYKLK